MSFRTKSLMKSFIRGLAAVIAMPLGGLVAQAQNSDDAGPVVVELFMSQSCSSCIVASDYLHALAAREDVIVLNWHVDYWNMLNTKNGRWVDPYSHAAFTKRQREYNKNIRHKSSVYTPQMIIGGVSEAAGFKTEKISTLIDKTRTQQHTVSIETRRTGKGVVFDVGESNAGGNAYVLTLLRETETHIPRGENAGRTLKEVNVVTHVQPLGVVRRPGARLSIPAPQDNASCAIIVQEPRQGRIIAAAYCPEND